MIQYAQSHHFPLNQNQQMADGYFCLHYCCYYCFHQKMCICQHWHYYSSHALNCLCCCYWVIALVLQVCSMMILLCLNMSALLLVHFCNPRYCASDLKISSQQRLQLQNLLLIVNPHYYQLYIQWISLPNQKFITHPKFPSSSLTYQLIHRQAQKPNIKNKPAQQLIIITLNPQYINYIPQILSQEQNQNMPPSAVKPIQLHKMLSTSMTFHPNIGPHWASDTQLNYMSQYDFITYDLEEDCMELIDRVLPSDEQICSVVYSPLIGHRNVRIIYLYKLIRNDDNKYQYQGQQNKYGIIVLPSLNFTEPSTMKKIEIPSPTPSFTYTIANLNTPMNQAPTSTTHRKIKHIQKFIYFADGQYILFLVLYLDGAIGLVYMSLSGNVVISHDITNQSQDTQTQQQNQQVNAFSQFQARGLKSKCKKSNKYHIKSMRIFCQQEPNSIEDQQISILENSWILFTKQLTVYLVVLNNRAYLMRISLTQRQFILLDSHQLQSCSLSHSARGSPPLPSHSICLSKTYLLHPTYNSLCLYCIEQQQIKFCHKYLLSSNSFISHSDRLLSVSASFNSNRIVIVLEGSNTVYQFRVNDISDQIQYLNCIQFQTECQGPVSWVVMSGTGRNVGVLSFADREDNPKNNTSINSAYNKKMKDVSFFSIFKIELYTELGIPQSSLYLKQLKYKNRTKRVNRLVMPKIYQKIYALTGSEVHTLDCHRTSGVLFLDIHPYGFYLALTYSPTIKIYSLQHSSMTLLYSLSLQQLKKVLYSPDGSMLVIFSGRKLKVLDAYSFEMREEINQKNNSIVDVCFGSRSRVIIVGYDNGIATERSLYDWDKVRVFRIFGHGHRKITGIRIDERNQTLLFLLQDGSLILKQMSNLTAPEQLLSYQDGHKISQVYVDTKNNLIFVGTKAGLLRIHSIAIDKFTISEYSQMRVTETQITAIVCSMLENYVYVGSLYGDITMIKFNPYSEGTLLAKSSKILKNIAPKVAAYFSFDFQLVSAAKFQGNSQLNALQDKLQNLIQKIQHHTNNFRQSVIKSYAEQQKIYHASQSQESKNAFKQFDAKTKKLKLDIHFLREKHVKTKRQLIQQSQSQLKQLYKVQQYLNSEILRLQRKGQQRIESQKAQCLREEQELKKQLEAEVDNMGVFYNKEKFAMTLCDLDEDYKISDADVLTTLNTGLDEDLRTFKIKCMELNKINSYLETAKVNIMARKVQQQTLEHRIHQQLKMLKQINGRQVSKMSVLTKQLRSTQDLIHRIQNKVKNTPNNVISSDKADSDLCSYKIWMKAKVQEEVDQLSQYLAYLDKNFQKKSQQIVSMTTLIKNNEQKTAQFQNNIQNLRLKLKSLQYKAVVLHNCNINLQKSLDPTQLAQYKDNYNQPHCQFEQVKIKKIVSMEKLNEKTLYSENRNLKIHTRKVKKLNKNNAQLLLEYQKLKYENKWLLDKQVQFQKQLQITKQMILAPKTPCLQSSKPQKTNINIKKHEQKSSSSSKSSTENDLEFEYKYTNDQNQINTKNQQNKKELFGQPRLIKKISKRSKILLRGICSQRTSLHKENAFESLGKMENKQTPFLKYVRERANKTKKSLNFNVTEKQSMKETATTTPHNAKDSRKSTVMRSATISRFF